MDGPADAATTALSDKDDMLCRVTTKNGHEDTDEFHKYKSLKEFLLNQGAAKEDMQRRMCQCSK